MRILTKKEIDETEFNLNQLNLKPSRARVFELIDTARAYHAQQEELERLKNEVKAWSTTADQLAVVIKSKSADVRELVEFLEEAVQNTSEHVILPRLREWESIIKKHTPTEQ